ncbi:MAG: glycosyltransferase family 2 protein [Planctomycetes bacterium]|nr:glycosyltransferase family 2 protein [Planctomycetota bacterium]
MALPPSISSLSIVVPVYNSAATLPKLAERLHSVLTDIGLPFEVVLVEDGSRDGSFEVIAELAQSRPWLRGFCLLRNFGQHNALLCGIRNARHAVIVTLDDDLQNPPEEIPRLLAKLSEGYDVVYGTPAHERHGFLRDLASRITKLTLQKAMGAETARQVSAYRAFRTELREAFADFRGHLVSIDVLLTWGTTRFAALRVEHKPRAEGRSNYTMYMLVTHALNMLTGFGTFPLQLASLTGFVFMLFGLGILVFVLASYAVRGSPVAGFPFLASIVAVFSGAQLFAIGIIGEYLARIHFRMMDRPTYVVRTTTETLPPSLRTTA